MHFRRNSVVKLTFLFFFVRLDKLPRAALFGSYKIKMTYDHSKQLADTEIPKAEIKFALNSDHIKEVWTHGNTRLS